jgi:hypothetical protein
MSQKDPDTLVPANDADLPQTARNRRAARVVEALRRGAKPRLDQVLASAGDHDLHDIAGQLSAAKDDIAQMLRDIADIEAMGDSTLQDHGAKAAAIRRLFAVMAGREPLPTEDVGVLMQEIYRMRDTMNQKERDLIAQDAELVQVRRDTELAGARSLGGHVAALEEEEIEQAKEQAKRATDLGEARVGLIKEQTRGDKALQEARNEGELQLLKATHAGELARRREELNRVVEGRPIEEEHLVHTQAADHAKRLLDLTGRIRVDRAETAIGDAVAMDDKKKADEHRASNVAHERNKRTSFAAMIVAQVGSGYLAAQGMHGIYANPEGASTWVLPIISSVAANGTVLVATSQILYGNLRLVRHPLIAGLFAGAVAFTTISGYAGAACDAIPGTVLADAVKDRVKDATRFAEEARLPVAQKFTDPASSLVLDMKQAGSALKDEATGRGPSHEYGFRSHSIDALARYRVTVDAAARGLASAGMCDDLRLMANDYQTLMDGLQYEYEHPTQAGGFAASPFVTLDENGEKKYDMTFDSQIASCDAAYPMSPMELIASIDSDLTAIREGLADGSVTNTFQLNEKIRNLNDKLQKLATALRLDTSKLATLAAGVTPTTTAGGAPAGTTAPDAATDSDEVTIDPTQAPDLHELDPMTYEAIKLLAEHINNFMESDWENFSLKYPAMAIVSTFIDQLGLALSLIALVTSRTLDKKNAKYIDSLARRQDGPSRVRQLLNLVKERLNINA